jgi:hypothetical protein
MSKGVRAYELHIRSLSIPTHLYRFRPSHGGNGCGSAQTLFAPLKPFQPRTPRHILPIPSAPALLDSTKKPEHSGLPPVVNPLTPS